MDEIIIYCEDIPRPEAIPWKQVLAGENRINLVYLPLERFREVIPRLYHHLNAAEQDTASRMRRDSQRDAYVLNHSVLRILLAADKGIVPREVDIRAGENGKPFLFGSGFPHFNLSDAEGAAMQAYAGHPLGVDLEWISPEFDTEPIASRFFSNRECRRIQKKGREWFFKYWTRKEALLKATGIGIAHVLPCIEVVGGVNIVNRRCAGSFLGKAKEYSIKSFRLDDYYVSIASERRETVLTICVPEPSELMESPV